MEAQDLTFEDLIDHGEPPSQAAAEWPEHPRRKEDGTDQQERRPRRYGPGDDEANSPHREQHDPDVPGQLIQLDLKPQGPPPSRVA